jgi:hypothetical protein
MGGVAQDLRYVMWDELTHKDKTGESIAILRLQRKSPRSLEVSERGREELDLGGGAYCATMLLTTARPSAS